MTTLSTPLYQSELNPEHPIVFGTHVAGQILKHLESKQFDWQDLCGYQNYRKTSEQQFEFSLPDIKKQPKITIVLLVMENPISNSDGTDRYLALITVLIDSWKTIGEYAYHKMLELPSLVGFEWEVPDIVKSPDIRSFLFDFANDMRFMNNGTIYRIKKESVTNAQKSWK